MTDRYAYIPSIGIFIMLAWGIPDLVRGWDIRRYVMGALGLAYLSLLIVIASTQISHWRSSVSLFEHAVEVVPNNWRIQVNLAQAILEDGRVNEAIGMFERIHLVVPSHEEALPYQALGRNGLGMAYEKQGRYDDAMKQYHEAIRIFPELVVANNNLGEILAKKGYHREAVFYFRQAEKHAPTSAVFHRNLAKSLAASGKTDGEANTISR